jgi:hypothetical protein
LPGEVGRQLRPFQHPPIGATSMSRAGCPLGTRT